MDDALDEMRIGELAARAGVSTRALRYYEEQGILQSSRTASGQRVYGLEAVDRVRLIQHLFSAGLASRTIAVILPCVDTGHAPPVMLESLHRERDRISQLMVDLEAARGRLDEVISMTENPDEARCEAVRDSAGRTSVILGAG
ncbi:MerR family transcriptional regulator [Herbiconiux sp. CPCC 205716]|uniref:MerR family transcriptional regulator n=1 Tax=Herbiconiux gentiana TaxID=2970912 RepID=A0ABT2GBP3_9MICO|nr:MerR family transcriptional regulator [Herbiconiux gentiana]MCS5713541.1 MerR family transcriptional regulator [Herbiconiux gentiana]